MPFAPKYYKPVPPSYHKKPGGVGLRCPECGGETAVLDSRTFGEAVRRRRCCLSCHLRFSTFEVAGDAPLDRTKLSALRHELTVLASLISEL